jgi:nucleoside phosphorylase
MATRTHTLGRIGHHNVVVACLASGVVGSAPAAAVAAQLLSTFPSIRFGLLAGIGGGAPSQDHDIRLGDVVVSNPQGIRGGVVQYDFGKTMAGGHFVRTGDLNKPPVVLLSAVSALRAQHELEENQLLHYLREMMDRRPKLRPKLTPPGPQQDQLFDANYDHQSSIDNCDQCDPKRLIHRSPGSVPAIHYGLIASAN